MTITQNEDKVIVVSEKDTFTYPSLTETTCDNGLNQICKVKFQLLGQFFEKQDNDEQVSSLIVSGLIKMALKARRRLQDIDGLINNGTPERKLETTNDVFEFKLMVNLANGGAEESTSDATMRGDALSYGVVAISGSALALW